MDRIDRAILRELQENARIPIVELAKRVNLTKTPCSERVRKLEQSGTIKHYRAELNPAALEAEHVVIVQVVLRGTTADELDQFNEAVLRVAEIQSCHMIAGDFDYLLKVRTRNIEHYRRIHSEAISRLPHVRQTHTYVVMESIKDAATIPVLPG